MASAAARRSGGPLFDDAVRHHWEGYCSAAGLAFTVPGDRAGRDPPRQSRPGQRRRTEIIGLPAIGGQPDTSSGPGRARHRVHLAHHAGRMAQRQVMSGSMARGYRRPAAAARALVAAYGEHHVLAVSRRASAHPERVDHQIEMPAPVEPWPRAHHANHAADQHPDVGRLYAGTDRPLAPGAFDQLCDDRDQFVLLGLRFRLRLPHCSPARTGPRRPRRPSPRYGAAAPRSVRTVLRRPRAPRAPIR